jgi:hypothetical protein
MLAADRVTLCWNRYINWTAYTARDAFGRVCTQLRFVQNSTCVRLSGNLLLRKLCVCVCVRARARARARVCLFIYLFM